jgi:hypothetical protein
MKSCFIYTQTATHGNKLPLRFVRRYQRPVFYIWSFSLVTKTTNMDALTEVCYSKDSQYHMVSSFASTSV